jgi:hypothetical protein
MKIMYFVAFRKIVRGPQAVVFPVPELRPAHQVSLITVPYFLLKIRIIPTKLRSHKTSNFLPPVFLNKIVGTGTVPRYYFFGKILEVSFPKKLGSHSPVNVG